MAEPTHPSDVIAAFLDSTGLAWTALPNDRFVTQLKGEHKLTIPVGLAIIGDELHLESFFMRRPQEDKERFADLLMRRNMRAPGVHYAFDADGDVHLVGRLPLAAVTMENLDRLFGALLVEADGTFDAAIAIGFASYLANDMAWRANAATETRAEKQS